MKLSSNLNPKIPGYVKQHKPEPLMLEVLPFGSVLIYGQLFGATLCEELPEHAAHNAAARMREAIMQDMKRKMDEELRKSLAFDFEKYNPETEFKVTYRMWSPRIRIYGGPIIT